MRIFGGSRRVGSGKPTTFREPANFSRTSSEHSHRRKQHEKIFYEHKQAISSIDTMMVMIVKLAAPLFLLLLSSATASSAQEVRQRRLPPANITKPETRYTAFVNVTEEAAAGAIATLNYTESTWNLPGTAESMCIWVAVEIWIGWFAWFSLFSLSLGLTSFSSRKELL